MENQSEKKWYQKPITVVLFLIFFFPVGLYLMWKHELWSKTARWIISAVFALAIIANAGKDKSTTSIPNSNSSTETEINAKCTQWDSKNAVEERIESLGYTQISINLNDNVGCRYQWLVQFISDNGVSGYCAMTTDGSSGIVEIVDVTCK